MRNVSSMIGLALLTFTGTALAQEEPPPPAPAAEPAAPAMAEPAPAASTAAAPAAGPVAKVGVDAAFQLPLGNMGDVTGMGFGGLLRGEYRLIPNLNATLRAGYIYSLKKDTAGFKSAVDDIPVWVGAKYFVNEMFYGGAEVGLNMLKSRVDGSLLGVPVSGSSTDNKFGGDVGVGALFGDFEARAQFQVMDFGHSKDSMAIMINVGYNFLKL